MMKRGVLVISSIVVILVLLATFFIVIVVTVKYVYKGDDAVRELVLESTPGGFDRDLGTEVKQPSPELEKQFRTLVEELNKPHNGPCLLPYKLDLGGFSVQFLRGNIGWTASLINPDKQGTHFEVIKNNQLCVVGGKITDDKIRAADFFEIAQFRNGKLEVLDSQTLKNLKNSLKFDDDELGLAAHNFYVNWIKEIEGASNIQLYYNNVRKNNKRIVSPDYSELLTLTITDSDSMEFVTFEDKKYSTGKEDGGLLYIPEQGKVCVVATIDDYGGACISRFGKGYNANGIDKHCPDFLKEKKALTKC